MTPAEVTVCIPAHPPRLANGMLERALRSVAAQTLTPAAVSVAIDLERRGAAHTRNRALRAAATEWVAFLDSDDEMYPQHLQRLVEHQQAGGADVVWPWFDTDPPGSDPFPAFEGRQYDTQVPHMFPIATLVRRELAVQVGGFPVGDPVSGMCAGEDWAFWLLLRDAGASFSHLVERTWRWNHCPPDGNTSGLPRW